MSNVKISAHAKSDDFCQGFDKERVEWKTLIEVYRSTREVKFHLYITGLQYKEAGCKETSGF